jgi:hypothetical protein
MATFCVQRNKNYTTMSNIHFRDKRLSFRAKGLLSTMLSLPEDWDYTLLGLTKLSTDGKDAIRSALKELENCGYLIRRRTTDEKGRYSSNEYLIYEAPQKKNGAPEPPKPKPKKPKPEPEPPGTGGKTDPGEPSSGKPTMDGNTPEPSSAFPTMEGNAPDPSSGKPTLEKPTLEKPTPENPTQLNTKLQITKDINTPIVPKSEVPECPVEEIRAAFNTLCPQLREAKRITGNRLRKVKTIWRDYPSLEEFQQVFTRVSASFFLTGKNDFNWKADLDWIMKPANWVNILEGKYDNRETPTPNRRDDNLL